VRLAAGDESGEHLPDVDIGDYNIELFELFGYEILWYSIESRKLFI
jgi:hypothetical protein